MATRTLRSIAATAAVLTLAITGQAPGSSSQALAAAQAGAGSKGTNGARTVTLEGIDAMKFVPAAIQARPGETLRVVVKTTSNLPKVVMAHNFVLLALGTDVTAFVNDAMKARATDFVPASRKAEVIAATGLAGKGETVEVTFTVPKKPGKYTFVCTFPGHFAGGMTGTLIVS